MTGVAFTPAQLANMRAWTRSKCVECGRVFDLSDENDADEYANGHDCEVPL